MLSIIDKIGIKLFGIKFYIKNNIKPIIKDYYTMYPNKIEDLIIDKEELHSHSCYTPLLYAIDIDRLDIAKCLIEEFNADVNHSTINSCLNAAWLNNAIRSTIFHCGEFDQINKTSENIRNNEFFDFFMYLLTKINIKDSNLIISFGTDRDLFNILHLAVYMHAYSIVKYILQNKILDVNSKTLMFDLTAINIAVQNNDVCMTEILHNYNTEMNLKELLFIAKRNNNLNMIYYLKSLEK